MTKIVDVRRKIVNNLFFFWLKRYYILSCFKFWFSFPHNLFYPYMLLNISNGTLQTTLLWLLSDLQILVGGSKIGNYLMNININKTLFFRHSRCYSEQCFIWFLIICRIKTYYTQNECTICKFGGKCPGIWNSKL